ncbi:iron chaperone [Pseudoclavibacter sp. JSM 162008]|uniref:iron chaperone n=1 Tax=Pseudoclavibacter sp. JSM 162008 TaxID=3229855 RepID=UPI003524CC95
MAETASSIDEYLEALSPEYRAELERIRSIVKRMVPEAEEKISYRMPTLAYKGRALVYFTASKKHLSFYPSEWAIEEFADRLTDYTTTKHAIQFTVAKPLPDALIEELVTYQARQIDAGRQQ